jgi:uncharacterized OB-fold protein
MNDEQRRRIHFRAVLPYRYAAGRGASRFFAELRDNKRIMAQRCSTCGKTYVPPRPLCGPCYEPLREWVEVGPRGTILGYTVVRFAFLDPLTGKERPVPYGYGFILLDGADFRIQHFIAETQIQKLRLGMRVEAVFREPRQGDFGDIEYFRVIDDSAGDQP